jgi:osmoprotectant transport system substrate-binding protein
MQRRGRLAVMLAALALLLTACGGLSNNDNGSSGQPSGAADKGEVRIGVVDFTEQHILTQIYGQVLQNAGYKVTYQTVASRELADPALFSGKLDMLIEYAGSMLIYLKGEPSSDADKVLSELKTKLEAQKVTALDQAPMADQNALTVTQATASKYNLKNITELAKVSPQLVFGGPPECRERDTCYKGLQQVYNVKFKSFESLNQGAIKYRALLNNQIQVALSFTTDGIIAKENLLLLQDDKGLFPADHALPVVRDDYLNKAGDEFKSLVNKVSAAVTTEEITKLNAQVDIDTKDADQVATQWLKDKGLLS